MSRSVGFPEISEGLKVNLFSVATMSLTPRCVITLVNVSQEGRDRQIGEIAAQLVIAVVLL